MNNEEKILAILEKHTEMFAQIYSRMDQMQGRMDQMQGSMDQMQEDIHRINARIDLDIGKRLDALSEGQDVIEQRLDGLDKGLAEVKKLAERTADKVDVIHAVVSQHSADITELKAVQ